MSAAEVMPEPEWLRLARATEAADRAARREDELERDETETVEAMETMWRGIWAQAPKDVIHYADPSWIEPACRGPWE